MGFFDDVGKWWDNTTGKTAKDAGTKAQNEAVAAGKEAAASSSADTEAAQAGLTDIAQRQLDYNTLQQNAQGQAAQLGQQAATGAGVSATTAARGAGLNKGQAALVGGKQAGEVYGNVYGGNVQQGIGNQQQGLASAAGTTATGAQIAQGQAGLGLNAAGQQATIGGNQLAAGTAQSNSLMQGVGQLAGVAATLSDERSKNISSILDKARRKSPNIDEILAKIKPIEYTYKPGVGEDSQKRIGVTAQDLETTSLAPAVKTDPASGLKSIDSAELSPALLNLVIQLAGQVKDLQSKVK